MEPYNRWKVGVYPIPGTNAYREFPSSNSILGDVWLYKSMPIVHTPVEREKIVHDIYSLVDPIDSHTPNTAVLANAGALSVKVIDANVLQVDWYVDGKLAARDGGESFPPLPHIVSPGRHTVRALVFDRVLNHAFSDRNGGKPDSLDWVRNDNRDLQQEVAWTLEFTTSAVAAKRRARGPGYGPVARSSGKRFSVDGRRQDRLRRPGAR